MGNATIRAERMAIAAEDVARALGHTHVSVIAHEDMIYVRCGTCSRYGILVAVTSEDSVNGWQSDAHGIWTQVGCLPF